MKEVKPVANHRRATLLILSGLLATLLVLASVQWMAADDGPQPTPTPGSESPYKDRVLSERELLELEPSLEQYMAAHLLSGDQLLGSDISQSTKEVDRDEVPAGGEINYTIVISNSGDTQFTGGVTDTLPAELSYVDHELSEMVGGISSPGFDVDGNVVAWKGVLVGGGHAKIIITARVNDNVEADTMIINTALISDGEQTVSPSAEVKVLELALSDALLPLITYGFQPAPPNITNFNATRPNSQNEFSLSWTGGSRATRYELEMADNPEFNSPTVYDMALSTSKNFKPEPYFRNLFYYRVRSFDGYIGGNWSDTVRVVGAYRDDFTDSSSGWAVRRTTHIDDVRSWYDIDVSDKDWFILQVEDRFDWGLASPLTPAPELPYVIEFDAQHAHIANQVTYGAAFGGDYPGEICPDKSTVDGWYKHELCFNHFYHTNTIWGSGHLLMLFERVDYLEWISNQAPPLKRRLGYHKLIDPLEGVSTSGWNHFRIEVRADEIKVFAGKRGETIYEVLTYDGTQWVNDPFFGVLVSTGEYSNSTMRVDYYAVTPLDN